MDEPKRYETNTLGEILEIPPEAFPRYIGDLKLLHQQYWEIKKECKERGLKVVKVANNVWIDDGMNRSRITIKKKQ